MEIVIKIPKEFEEYFNSDRFEDILQRVRVDIHKSIISGRFVLSGNREKEALDMLTDAFLNSTPLPKGHGDLIDRNELLDESYQIDSMYCMYDEVVNVDDIKNAPTLIEGSKG